MQVSVEFGVCFGEIQASNFVIVLNIARVRQVSAIALWSQPSVCEVRAREVVVNRYTCSCSSRAEKISFT